MIPGSNQGSIPEISRLEEVVRQLEGRGEHRALVSLVETWAVHGEPTKEAKLALARSLLRLFAIDRAWARLRDLVEASEPNPEAVEIAAEMFLLRGWPNQARKVIARGLERSPDREGLLALESRASEFKPSSEEPPPETEDLSAQDLVRAAEHYLARGSMVRARSLLERARRKAPESSRVRELLWAMDGLFVGSESLHSMCERWLQEDTDPNQSQPQDLSEEPEHTENVRKDELRPQEGEDAFPKLFRNLPAQAQPPDAAKPEQPPSEAAASVTPRSRPRVRGPAPSPNDFDSNEQTAITSMAELQAAVLQERTDAGEDTQIARVMSKSGVQQVSGAVHLNPSPVDAKFDLDEYRREMGMTNSGLDSDFGGPEDEDDSVVILTGQDREEAAETSETGKLEIDSRLMQHEARAKEKLAAVEESWVIPPAPSSEESEGTDSDEVLTKHPGPNPAGPSPAGPSLSASAAQKSSAKRALDETAEFNPRGLAGGKALQHPAFHSSGALISWPYWIAALSTVIMLFALIFFAMVLIKALVG